MKSNPPPERIDSFESSSSVTLPECQHAANYDESLARMKRHLPRLAERYRVDVSDIRQTLYLVWTRVDRATRGEYSNDRDAFYRYLYRALVNELNDSLGTQVSESLDDPDHTDLQGWQADNEPGGLSEYVSTDTPLHLSVPAVEDQIRSLFARCCSEIAFPEAVRAHPLYAHPSYRAVLDGILAQESAEQIARRMGVSKRRINAQIEDIHRLFSQPDPQRIDRIFRALSPERWLPANTLVRRPLRSLRLPCMRDRSGARVLAALRQFVVLGTQPAIVHVDQFNRVLREDEVCVAARIMGLESISTLLQVVSSDSPDMDDPAYTRLRAVMGNDSPVIPQLIPALEKLHEQGALSPVVATLLDGMSARGQFSVLRELGTVLVPMLSSAEVQALVQAHQSGELVVEARRLHAQLCERLRLVPGLRT